MQNPSAVIAALMILAAAPAAPAQGDTPTAASPDGRVFLELTSARSRVYVHEPVRVVLRFGIERSLLEHELIQPFQRVLDVPVQLHVPWVEGLPCTRPLPERDAPVSGPSLALEQGLARVRRSDDEQHEGRTWAVFELERSFLPLCPGTLTFPAPHLRFAYASRFDVDALGQSVPADRHDELVAGRDLTLEILPLPEAGRPARFTGAVGRLTVRAEAHPLELDEGQSLKLVLHIEGPDDLTHFDPPRLDDLAGFRVRGWVEELAPGRRSVTYDVAPLSARVQAVPALALPYFDPGPPPLYRTARTEPIALTVRSVATPLPADEPAAAPEPASDGRPSLGLILGALSALLIVGVVSRFALRRRRRRPGPGRTFDPLLARKASDQVNARATEPGVDLAQAVSEYLAARLHCAVPAVIGPGLLARLRAAGVRDDPAERMVALLEELVAARYGGSLPADAQARAGALVEELEPGFHAGGSER